MILTLLKSIILSLRTPNIATLFSKIIEEHSPKEAQINFPERHISWADGVITYMKRLWKWLKSKCKCTKRCKCWHCRARRSLSKKYTALKNWLWDHFPSTELLKALGLIAASLWLWFTGSIECTASVLLLGWGLLELKEYWYWK
jgi:hypothetical protein